MEKKMNPDTRKRLTQDSMIEIFRKYDLKQKKTGCCYGFTMLEGLYHLQSQPPTHEDIKIFLEILDQTNLPVRKVITESNFAKKASLLNSNNLILIEKSLEIFQKNNPMSTQNCEKLKKYLYETVKRPLLYEENMKILCELENLENKEMVREIIQNGAYMLRKPFNCLGSQKKISGITALAELTGLKDEHIEKTLSQALNSAHHGQFFSSQYDDFIATSFKSLAPRNQKKITTITRAFLEAQLIFNFSCSISALQISQFYNTNTPDKVLTAHTSQFKELHSTIFCNEFNVNSLEEFLKRIQKNNLINSNVFIEIYNSDHSCYLNYDSLRQCFSYWDPNCENKYLTYGEVAAKDIASTIFKSTLLYEESKLLDKAILALNFIGTQQQGLLKKYLLNQEVCSDRPKLLLEYMKRESEISVDLFLKQLSEEDKEELLNGNALNGEIPFFSIFQLFGEDEISENSQLRILRVLLKHQKANLINTTDKDGNHFWDIYLNQKMRTTRVNLEVIKILFEHGIDYQYIDHNYALLTNPLQKIIEEKNFLSTSFYIDLKIRLKTIDFLLSRQQSICPDLISNYEDSFNTFSSIANTLSTFIVKDNKFVLKHIDHMFDIMNLAIDHYNTQEKENKIEHIEDALDNFLKLIAELNNQINSSKNASSEFDSQTHKFQKHNAFKFITLLTRVDVGLDQKSIAEFLKKSESVCADQERENLIRNLKTQINKESPLFLFTTAKVSMDNHSKNTPSKSKE